MTPFVVKKLTVKFYYIYHRVPEILELLAFDAQKFTGSRDRDHAHILDIFVTGHVGTVPGNSFIHFFSGNKAHKTTDKRSDIKKHTQT